ncbi:tetratricopeptide repeat protein [Flavobacteriales bacterium]|nr:tetratricopeptide repeat protein [Flavobacteriales bacterium]
MKKIILFLNIFLCLNLQANDSLFINANQDYANQSYSLAIDKYQSIISSGTESSELYYNLGNSYYRLNEIHQAIYFYEKSLKINPNFTEAIENLELCNQLLIDKIEKMPEIFYKIYYENLKNFLSIKWWKITSLIFIWIYFLFYLTKIPFKKRFNFSQNIVLVLSFLCFLIFQDINNDSLEKREAIIYSQVIDIMSAPSNQANKLFTLHIGSKVTINDQIENWVNISLANGNKGWIALRHLKEI